jgi:hypothetical protein
MLKAFPAFPAFLALLVFAVGGFADVAGTLPAATPARTTPTPDRSL